MIRKHPDPGEWADFVRDLVIGPRRDALERHRQSCRVCRRTTDALARVQEVGATDARLGPSLAALGRAEASFVPRRRAEPWPVRVARLVTDSWHVPAHAGVRAAAEPTDRYLAYRTGPWNIDVRLEVASPRRWRLRGQLFHSRDRDLVLTGIPVAVLAGQRTVARTLLDTLGEFQLDGVAASARLSVQIPIAQAGVALTVPLRPPAARTPARPLGPTPATRRRRRT